MEETPQPRQLRCFQLQHYSTNPGFVTSMKCGFHVLQSTVLHVRYLDTHGWQHVLGSTWKLSNVRGNCSQRRHQDGLVATFGNFFFLHKAVISLQISVMSPEAGESPTTEAPVSVTFESRPFGMTPAKDEGGCAKHIDPRQICSETTRVDYDGQS